jgi:H+/Cl- antiporter ClcA
MVLLAVLKLVATALCYGSGNAGGIFGPSLFIGAMIGGAVGSVAHALFPAYTADPGAYALVGMGTAFAGIVWTPLTSVIMIFELTRDYTIIVPLMISNLIAFFISYNCRESRFTKRWRTRTECICQARAGARRGGTFAWSKPCGLRRLSCIPTRCWLRRASASTAARWMRGQ